MVLYLLVEAACLGLGKGGEADVVVPEDVLVLLPRGRMCRRLHSQGINHMQQGKVLQKNGLV